MFDGRFLRGPRRPTRENLYVSSASGTRQSETPSFGSPGPQARENLASLRAPTPQTHKKTGHKVSKRVPERARMQQKRTLLQLLFSSSILKCLFKRFRREMYQRCIQNGSKNDILLETTPKMENCVSTAPARADRGSDPPENHTKT